MTVVDHPFTYDETNIGSRNGTPGINQMPGLEYYHPSAGAAQVSAGRKGAKTVGNATVSGLQRCMQQAMHAMRAYQTVANRRPPTLAVYQATR